MGIPEISAALAGTNHAIKIVAAVLKTAKDVEVKQAVASLQDHIIDLQTKLFAIQSKYEELAEVKRQAEQKVMAYEKWDTEAARYQLQEIASGMFVYVLKSAEARGEPIHWLCPHCFQQSKKSILFKPVVDYLNHKCPACEFEIIPTQPQRSFGGGSY